MCDYTISRRQRRSDKETAFVEIIVKNFPNVIKASSHRFIILSNIQTGLMQIKNLVYS